MVRQIIGQCQNCKNKLAIQNRFGAIAYLDEIAICCSNPDYVAVFGVYELLQAKVK